MTTNSIYLGQSRVVGFFAVCCVLAGLGVFRSVTSEVRIRLGFAIAECAFILVMGIAAWYLYQSRKAGWYLTLVVVLIWFLVLPAMKILWSAYTIALTFGMFAVLAWLLQPRVKANYGVKF